MADNTSTEAAKGGAIEQVYEAYDAMQKEGN